MFCKKCGNQLDDAAAFCPKCGTSQNSDEREMLLKKFDDCADTINALKQQEKAVDDQQSVVAVMEKKTSNKAIVISVLIGLFIALWLGVMLVAVGGSGAVGDILGIIAIGGCVAIGVKKKKQNIAAYQKEKATLEQYQQVLKRLVNDPKLEWLPEDIKFGLALDQIYNNLKNMRANTLKEAINLFVEDIHKAVVESNTSQALEAAQNAESAARSAAFWSRW